MFKCEAVAAIRPPMLFAPADDDGGDQSFTDCNAVCGFQIDGTAGNTCKNTCNKVMPHGGSHYCTTHGAF